MEQRLTTSWRMTVNEKKFIETALLSDLRIDGRGPFDYRNVKIQFGCEDGSAEVQLGQTRAMAFVTSQLVQPYKDRPNEGTLAIFVEFSPMADPSFEAGRPGEFAVELGRIVDRGLRESRAVDTETLCVVAGKWVWSIRIDLHILDNGGNLVDAANIAALAALLTFRRPECTLGEEDGVEIIIHPPEVREPIPLIVHHLPIAVTFAFIGEETRIVLDPSQFEEAVMGGKLTVTLNANGDVCSIQKAGGDGVIQSVIMQCLRIASMKAAEITDKIKKAVDVYNTGRALRKIKRHPDTVDVVCEAVGRGANYISKEMEEPKSEIKDESISGSETMEIETHTPRKDRSGLVDKKPKIFTGGPSNWDPYSTRDNADELTTILASQAAEEKMDQLPSPAQPQFTTAGASTVGTEPRPSSLGTAGAEEKNNEPKPKTLKDAVKPKHKRKQKKKSNAEGI